MPVAQVLPTEGVIVHEDAGDAFLLHVESGRYFGLNRSGLVIWQAIVDGQDPLAALVERWPDVPRDQLAGDVDALVASLQTAGLARDADAPPTAPA